MKSVNSVFYSLLIVLILCGCNPRQRVAHIAHKYNLYELHDSTIVVNKYDTAILPVTVLKQDTQFVYYADKQQFNVKIKHDTLTITTMHNDTIFLKEKIIQVPATNTANVFLKGAGTAIAVILFIYLLLFLYWFLKKYHGNK